MTFKTLVKTRHHVEDKKNSIFFGCYKPIERNGQPDDSSTSNCSLQVNKYTLAKIGVKVDGSVIINVGYEGDFGILCLSKPNDDNVHVAYPLRLATNEKAGENPVLSLRLPAAYIKAPFRREKVNFLIKNKEIYMRIPSNHLGDMEGV